MNKFSLMAGTLLLVAAVHLGGCAPHANDASSNATSSTSSSSSTTFDDATVNDSDPRANRVDLPDKTDEAQASSEAGDASAAGSAERAAALAAELNIVQDFRSSFDHGPKPAENQKYIVLHDTEGDGDAASVIDWWDSNGNLVAAHFVINKDGSVYQAVPLDRITHHAGYGDAGHNSLFGITEDGRDDMKGAVPIGSWAPDYGMNAWSIGIEMVHVGGSGDYPQAQLETLDKLIAYIDATFGFESTIIDHKDWRSGNSDTSPEFAPYFANYKTTRTHDGA